MSALTPERRAELEQIGRERAKTFPPLRPEQLVEIRRLLGPLQYPKPVKREDAS